MADDEQAVISMKEQERVRKLLESGKLWDKIVFEELEKKHIGDLEAKEIVFLCALGRLVKNKKPYSFNVIAHSASSAGKDHLISSILDLFLPADIENYGRISPRALNRLHDRTLDPEWTYDGKILYLEEIEENVLNNEVMKVFTAGSNKSAIVTDRSVKIFEPKGKPVVFTTTATTIPTEEILNRFVIVKLDESEEQTRRTFLADDLPYNEAIRLFLSNLKPMIVEIPFEKKIAKVFPINKMRNRRDYQRFLDWVRAVAIFNQALRYGHTTETIKAELADYDIAKEAFMHACSGVADVPLKQIDKKIIEVLKKADEPLSAREISVLMDGYITLKPLYPRLDNLANKGVLEVLELRESFSQLKNVPVTKYALSQEFTEKNPIKLPDSDDL